MRVELSDRRGALRGDPIECRFTTLGAFVAGCLVPAAQRSLPPQPDAADDEDERLPTLSFGMRRWFGLQPADLGRVGFLAQYKLLEQIPELKAEIGAVPYSDQLGRGLMRRTNVWLGAAGATTALHFDPSDNWLCNVAGFKYVRLYAARHSPLMYQESPERRRFANEMLRSAGNFSFADVEPLDPQENERDFPKLAAAPYTETILGPGEMLYIPWGCWHYCRALTVCVSINVWWHRHEDELRQVPCWGDELGRRGLIESIVRQRRLPGDTPGL